MAILALEQDLYVVLLLATVNRICKALEGKIANNTIQIGLDAFLERLNAFSRAFRKQYGYQHDDIIERPCLKKLLEESEMHKVTKIEGNIVLIQTIPEIYEEAMTNSVVEAGMRYSSFLTKNINDLATLYAHEYQEEQDLTKEGKEALDEKPSVEKKDAEVLEEDASMAEEIETGAVEEGGSEEGETEQASGATVPEVAEKLVEVTVGPSEGEEESKDAEPEGAAAEEAPVEKTKPEETSVAFVVGNEDKNEEEVDVEDNAETHKSDDGKSEADESTPEPLLKPDTPSSGRKRSLSPSASSYQQRKRFQHIAINLVNSIQAHRFSSPFLQAVNKKEALDYDDVIYNPKHLKGILRSIKLKQEPYEYNTIKELERDIMLMFANCIMYNRSDADLVELTKSMKEDVNNTFKMFEEAESEMK